MFVGQSAAFSAADRLSVCPPTTVYHICLPTNREKKTKYKIQTNTNTEMIKIQELKVENVKYKILVVASAVFADQSRKSEAWPKINRDIVGNDLVLPKLTAAQY